MILKKSCGLSTRLKGFQDIVNILKVDYLPTLTGSDLWELVSLRMLRRLLKEGKIRKVEKISTILSAVIGSSLINILQKRRQKIICDMACAFSPVLESIKLLSELNHDELSDLIYKNYFFEPSLDEVFDFLNRDHDFNRTIRYEHHAFWKQSSDSFKTILIDLLKSNQIIYCNFSKWYADKTEYLFEVLNLDHEQVHQETSLFIVFRGTKEVDKYVTNILGERFNTLNIFKQMQKLNEKGYYIKYFYESHFDNNFLLPYEGEAGLCMMHISKDKDQLISVDTFEPFNPLDGPSETKTLMRVESDTNQDYCHTVNWSLPLMHDLDDPDWETWNEEANFDYSKVNWSENKIEESSEQVLMAFLSRVDKDKMAAIDINHHIRVLVRKYEEGKASIKMIALLIIYCCANDPKQAAPLIQTALQLAKTPLQRTNFINYIKNKVNFELQSK